MRQSPRKMLPFPTSRCGCLTRFPTRGTSFQNYCKVWISSLGIVHSSSILVFLHMFFLAVRKFLNSLFTEQWLAWSGPAAWRACSTDLVPWTIWGHLMPTVYATKFNDVQDLDLRWFVRYLELPASQTITVQTSNVFLRSSSLTLNFFYLKEAHQQKTLYTRKWT
jgi:hypothetical protein